MVLAPHQLLDPAPDHGQLLAGTEPVDAAGAHPGGDLVLQRGDPDLVELVEQLGEDGEELHPLQQRLPVVLGQVEQPRPEVEPRLLAVGEALVPEGLDLLVRRRDRAFDGRRLGRVAATATWGSPVRRGLRLGLLRLGLGHGAEVQRRCGRGGCHRDPTPHHYDSPGAVTNPSHAVAALRLRSQAQAAHRIGPAALRLAADRRAVRHRRARA